MTFVAGHLSAGDVLSPERTSLAFLEKQKLYCIGQCGGQCGFCVIMNM